MSVLPARRFHLIIDAFGCNKGLDDESFLSTSIKEIVSLLEMKIIKGPVVVNVPEGNPGITAFAIIDFSHIAIHTFINDSKFYLDIFSCKPFDILKLKNYVKDVFELSEDQIVVSSLQEPDKEGMSPGYKLDFKIKQHSGIELGSKSID